MTLTATVDKPMSHQSQAHVVGCSGSEAGDDVALGDGPLLLLGEAGEWLALGVALSDAGGPATGIEPVGSGRALDGWTAVADAAAAVVARLVAPDVAADSGACLGRCVAWLDVCAGAWLCVGVWAGLGVWVGVVARVGVWLGVAVGAGDGAVCVDDGRVGVDDGAVGVWLGCDRVGVGRAVGASEVRVGVGSAAVGVGNGDRDGVAFEDRDDVPDGRGLGCGRAPTPHDTSNARQSAETGAETMMTAVLGTSLLEDGHTDPASEVRRLVE